VGPNFKLAENKDIFCEQTRVLTASLPLPYKFLLFNQVFVCGQKHPAKFGAKILFVRC